MFVWSRLTDDLKLDSRMEAVGDEGTGLEGGYWEIRWRGMWMDSRMALCRHIVSMADEKALQRTPTAEEAVNNRVGEITHSVNGSQPLSPATLALIRWVHVAEMEDKQQEHPLLETDPAAAIAECLTFQQQSPTLTPHHYAIVPQEDQPAPWEAFHPEVGCSLPSLE